MDFMDRYLTLVRDYGLEYFKRWYGWYPGEVVSNEVDGESKGRVFVRVPMLQMPDGADTIPNPAYPMFGPFTPGPDKGSYNVPRVGDSVWVSFRNGDPSIPMYAPWGWFGNGEKPTEFESVEDRGWKTHAGHVVRFRDVEGDEAVLIQHKTGGKIEFDVSDKITIETNAGDRIIMDPNGSILIQQRAGTRAELTDSTAEIQASVSAKIKAPTIVLEGGNVELAAPGAVHPAVKGDILMIWLQALYAWVLAHTHPTTGPPPAPTGPPLPVPPVPSPPGTMLSSKTKTA